MNLHLGVTRLLQRGKSLLLLGCQNRLQKHVKLRALSCQFGSCASGVRRERTNVRFIARVFLDRRINCLFRLQKIHHVGPEGLLVIREVLLYLLLLGIREIQLLQDVPNFMMAPPSVMLFSPCRG